MDDTTAHSDPKAYAPFQVLTDHALWRLVVSFQTGIPLPLYHFWLAQNPPRKRKRKAKRPAKHHSLHAARQPFTFSITTASPTSASPSPFHILPLNPFESSFMELEPYRHIDPLSSKFLLTVHGARNLVSLVVKRGTPKLLELTTKIHLFEESADAFRRTKPDGTQIPAELLMEGAIYEAVEQNRADMLEWFLAQGLERDPRRLWVQAIKHFQAGDTRVLNVLLVYTEDVASELARVFSADLTLDTIKDVMLVDWLLENAPNVASASEFMAEAVARGDLATLKFLGDHHGHHIRDTQLFGVAYERGHMGIMQYFLEHHRDLIDLLDVRRVLLDGHAMSVRVTKESSGFAGFVEALVAEELASPSREMKLLAHLCKNDMIPSETRISIDSIVAAGNWCLVRMLQAKGLAVATTEAMDGSTTRLVRDPASQDPFSKSRAIKQAPRQAVEVKDSRPETTELRLKKIR